MLSLTSSKADQLILPADVISIEEMAFEGDESLDEVVLPNGIKQIGAYAFANTNISVIHIPESVEFIGEKAFDNIPSLTVYSTSNSYTEQYCDDYDIAFVEPDKIGNQYYVTFYDESDNIISRIKYNYGEPLILSSTIQQIYLNETYIKQFDGWEANKIIVSLPKYVRNSWDFHAHYIITRQADYNQHYFFTWTNSSGDYMCQYYTMVPSDWSCTSSQSENNEYSIFTNGDFTIKIGYKNLKLGSSTTFLNRMNSMLDKYSRKGTGTSTNGIEYRYGESGSSTSGYSKLVIKHSLNTGLYDHNYDYLYFEAESMTGDQLAWFDYIVSTLSITSNE